jgi:hypothetical protein
VCDQVSKVRPPYHPPPTATSSRMCRLELVGHQGRARGRNSCSLSILAQLYRVALSLYAWRGREHTYIEKKRQSTPHFHRDQVRNNTHIMETIKVRPAPDSTRLSSLTSPIYQPHCLHFFFFFSSMRLMIIN